jgi:hypothetical protein
VSKNGVTSHTLLVESNNFQFAPAQQVRLEVEERECKSKHKRVKKRDTVTIEKGHGQQNEYSTMNTVVYQDDCQVELYIVT